LFAILPTETAINIGYSCQLLTDELADVFIVDGNSVEEVEKQLRQFKESIKIYNRFRPGGKYKRMNLYLKKLRLYLYFVLFFQDLIHLIA